jgi:hypothetical protein
MQDGTLLGSLAYLESFFLEDVVARAHRAVYRTAAFDLRVFFTQVHCLLNRRLGHL